MYCPLRLWLADPLYGSRCIIIGRSLSLNAGHGVIMIEAEVMGPAEAVAGTAPSTLGELIPCHLSPVQQRQLVQLLEQYQDIFSHHDENLKQTAVLEHTNETQGPPVRPPYRRQSPTVWREEVEQVQQMLESSFIRPSNNPWASHVVMVQKKDGKLCFCVDLRQLKVATIKDVHPSPRTDELLDTLHGT